jgi:hypothetical protein
MRTVGKGMGNATEEPKIGKTEEESKIGESEGPKNGLREKELREATTPLLARTRCLRRSPLRAEIGELGIGGFLQGDGSSARLGSVYDWSGYFGEGTLRRRILEKPTSYIDRERSKAT